jgi:hypothetical protein
MKKKSTRKKQNNITNYQKKNPTLKDDTKKCWKKLKIKINRKKKEKT